MRRDPSQTVKIERLSGNKKDIDAKQFEADIKNKLEIPHENASIEDMYENYIKDITSIIEKHASIPRGQLTNRKCKTWYDKDALKVKRRKAKKYGIKANLNQIKGTTYMLTNAFRDTSLKKENSEGSTKY